MFADVLLPLPLRGTFTYSVPDEMLGSVKPGHRVVVPFGNRKHYTGIVTNLSPREPEGYSVKPIAQTLDDTPIVRHPQLKLWEWMAEYYLCSPGEVYRAALPAGLKVESETWIELNPEFEESLYHRLSDRELYILQTLDHAGKGLSIAEIERTTGFHNVGYTASRLLEMGAVSISEKLVNKYRAKKITCVSLTGEPGDEEWTRKAFETVKGAPKQERALLALLDMTGFVRGESTEVTRENLMERAAVSSAIIKVMADRKLFNIYKKEINRFKFEGVSSGELPRLSKAQQMSLDTIHRSWKSHDTTLLHGVTGSGKTEIYMHLIDYVLMMGRQVLFLVPEIALTTQLTTRLQRVFGEKIVIYHSKFTDNERVDIWRKLLKTSEPLVVLGARSAVFLPFASLGLVIVDEEHEPSYKQVDPAPRYNGRDTALMLARMHGAKSLLGSATPAIETYAKCFNGRYGLSTLLDRYGDVQLPSMQLVDMKLAYKKHQVNGPFAVETHDIITEAIANDRQAIVFLNRRGYAPMVMCTSCGWIPKCEACDVALTYHQRIDRLVCHYCGTQYPVPQVCPACGEPGLEIKGFGTERIEEEIVKQFPDVPMSRLDLDTTRNKDGYENVITEFSQRKTSILVGTQMVTKGLDFAGVSAVAVVNADMMINMPDFRATERAFNMIEQVAGRAGRRDTVGTVAIQTYNPSHPIFTHLLKHDYAGFYDEQIEERQLYNYPPFTRIIYIYIKHRDERVLDNLASRMGQELRQLLGNRVNGPDLPHVSRVQSLFIRRLMLKVEVNASMAKVKQLLLQLHDGMVNRFHEMKQATVYYDVDPV